MRRQAFSFNEGGSFAPRKEVGRREGGDNPKKANHNISEYEFMELSLLPDERFLLEFSSLVLIEQSSPNKVSVSSLKKSFLEFSLLPSSSFPRYIKLPANKQTD